MTSLWRNLSMWSKWWCNINWSMTKTNKMAYAPTEDSDHPGIRPVWSVFALCLKVFGPYIRYPKSTQRRLIKLGFLSLRLAHMYFRWFRLTLAYIWATTWQNQQNDWAPSEDSDQPSLSAWRNLRSLATHWVHSEDWSDWVDAQADLSLRWAHSHFVGFVMLRLILFSSFTVNILIIHTPKNIAVIILK